MRVVGVPARSFALNLIIVVMMVGDGVLENGRVGRDTLNALSNTLAEAAGLDEGTAHVIQPGRLSQFMQLV